MLQLRSCRAKYMHAYIYYVLFGRMTSSSQLKVKAHRLRQFAGETKHLATRGAQQHSPFWPLVCFKGTYTNKCIWSLERRWRIHVWCTHMWLERIRRNRSESSLLVSAYFTKSSSRNFVSHTCPSHTARWKLEVNQTHNGLSKCN